MTEKLDIDHLRQWIGRTQEASDIVKRLSSPGTTGDYQILATSPYNVVLQQHVRAPDDGSLSRRAAARLARYVNLEVAEGDAPRQQEMLNWLENHLPFVA